MEEQTGLQEQDVLCIEGGEGVHPSGGDDEAHFIAGRAEDTTLLVRVNGGSTEEAYRRRWRRQCWKRGVPEIFINADGVTKIGGGKSRVGGDDGIAIRLANDRRQEG